MRGYPKWMNEYLEKHPDVKVDDPAIRGTNKVANVERDTRHALQRKTASEANHQRVVIRVHSIRKRRTDPDAICAKWVIDSLVTAGVLPDDSQDYVEEVRFSQEEGEPERAIITVETAEDA